MKWTIAFCTALTFSQITWSQSTCETISECQVEAEIKSFTYLPRYLEERKIICGFSSDPSCFENAVRHAHEVLSCSTSETREQQMAEFDRKQFQGFLGDYGTAEVPEKINGLFKQLSKAAERISQATFPWKLTAYNANFINAHAGADSQVMASSGLWASESILEQEEIAAILAHEAAHIIQNHSLQLGCLALEWTNPGLELSEAMDYFREDFSTETERGQVWSRLSNKIEFEADAIATIILKEAGLDPLAMSRALMKLRPKNGGGFSSGSHPDLEARILAALKQAKAIH